MLRRAFDIFERDRGERQSARSRFRPSGVGSFGPLACPVQPHGPAPCEVSKSSRLVSPGQHMVFRFSLSLGTCRMEGFAVSSPSDLCWILRGACVTVELPRGAA